MYIEVNKEMIKSRGVSIGWVILLISFLATMIEYLTNNLKGGKIHFVP
jgi:hypothetical protein